MSMQDPHEAERQRQAERDYLKPKPGEAAEKKTVSSKAMSRLQVAAGAIAETKRAIPKQGNQVQALASSKMNSAFRLNVMRDRSCWDYTTDLARQLAAENPEADFAAKADLAHGGNCGEHAWVAYHYLRLHAKGEHIQVSQQKDFDHAFVLIGDLKKDSDQEIAVSDPWPMAPTACLWEDHFAFCTRDMILDHQSQVADGKSFKSSIAAGLKLSAKGEQMVQAELSKDETKKMTSREGAEQHHYWDHPDTTSGKKIDYQVAGAEHQPHTEEPKKQEELH